MANLCSWFSSLVEHAAAGIGVGPYWLLLGMSLIATGWMHFSGGIIGQTLWSYAGSLRNFDARVGNWATAPRLTASLVCFLLFDLLFAAIYGDAAIRASYDANLLSDTQGALMRRLAVPAVLADWSENALLLVLILSANWRLAFKRRWDFETEAVATQLRELESAGKPSDEWQPWFLRKRKERWAYHAGKFACRALALTTTLKFGGVLAMMMLLLMGRAT
jgi:hypothetical protein